ncbi:hypothetical protein ALC57_03383 [Trachymyrmex cornetzi]|uniref:Uncharacterized protein n=1 Tax=Trachymyrmex cornetzi TaxID=471704 RepID=A0A195EFV3_9HYME|nr:hypothetical protein ALC57_03383 [Trachymyrmex cornetzi]
MGFAAASLTVGEARGHATLKDRLHQWFSRVLVNYLVVTRLIERIIKSEDLVLKIFREIDFGLRLMHYHLILTGHADHVDLLTRMLLLVKWTFPHAHSDLMILHGVSLPQRPKFYAVLVFSRRRRRRRRKRRSAGGDEARRNPGSENGEREGRGEEDVCPLAMIIAESHRTWKDRKNDSPSAVFSFTIARREQARM